MLGLRFRDATTERPVTDGLQVTVRRKGGSGPPTQAVRTVSGAYVAQGLAGLRTYERVSEDIPEDIPEDVDVPDLEKQVPYLVDVRDRHERFVPVLLKVKLPYTPEPERGGLHSVAETPSDIEAKADDEETPEPACYLFSAVQRPVTAGQAVVYADLVAKKEGAWQPAAHAVLEVRHVPESSNSNGGNSNGIGSNDATWYGIANADGRVAVQFPLPPVKQFGNNNGSGRLSNYTWQLGVSVLYEPSTLEVPGNADRPLLPSIFQQKSGTLYITTDADGSETLSPTLSYREPLALTTGDLSVLRIGPPDGS